MDAANAALPAYVLTLQFFVGLLIRISDIPGEHVNFMPFGLVWLPCLGLLLHV